MKAVMKMMGARSGNTVREHFEVDQAAEVDGPAISSKISLDNGGSGADTDSVAGS